MSTQPYNRLVLIGNGFDRALGLNSSFSHFILSYLQDVAVQCYKLGKFETPLIHFKRQNIQFSGTSQQIEQKFRNTTSVEELMEYVTRVMDVTYPSIFFKKLIEITIELRWVDIENEYYKELRRIFVNFKTTGRDKPYLNQLISLNQSMDEMTKALHDHIKKEQDALNIQYSTSHMSSLIDYVRTQIPKDRSVLIPNFDVNQDPSEVIFLNFNYTNTIQSLLNNTFVGSNNAHIHIHGSVEAPENPIIFGYGDDTGQEYAELESEGNNEFLRIIKSFQYPRSKNYHTLLKYISGYPFDVYIVGHSCGLSDRTMLKTIFEHENCFAIQNFHYRGEKEDFEKRMEISRHFSDKVKMRERVLPFDPRAQIPQT